MRTTLLLDCDGILTNYVGQVVALVNELQSDRVFVESDITSWEASRFVPPDKKKEYWKRCKAPGFVASMKPCPLAQAAVFKLHSVAEIVVVTSYLKGATTWCHERDTWLKEHFDIRPENIIHTRAKQHVFGHVFVDDALKNVIPWAARYTDSCALLWDKPYNRDLADVSEVATGRYARIHNWDNVLDAVSYMRSLHK